MRPDDGGGRGASIPGLTATTPPSASTAIIADRSDRRRARARLADVEWRVQWRRADWQPSTGTKHRLFTRQADAEAFAAKLRRPYGGLARATVRVSSRPVGAWCGGRWSA